MKIISCDRCVVVFDQDKINFPSIFDDSGELSEKNAIWNDELDKYVPVVDCPVCGNKIMKEL